MRTALGLVLLALPAQAWEFSPLPVCMLSHREPAASVRVTHDPRLAEPFAIAITRPAGWSGGSPFSIEFEGGRGLTISTDRQRLSDDRQTLTVTDQGFGNLLDGLEFNRTATAVLGEATVSVPLAGAAPAVRAFRACAAAPTA